MSKVRRRPLVVGLVLVAVMVTAGAVVVIADPFRPDPNEVCDGVTREAWGCDPDQPSFSATTCAGVGEEFGSQLDRRALAIIRGPAGERGETRATRMASTKGLLSVRVNQYLRRNGMAVDCDLDEFLPAAESRFSQELRDRAGEVLFDGDVVYTYEDWLEDLVRFVRVIDLDEHEPVDLPASTG